MNGIEYSAMLRKHFPGSACMKGKHRFTFCSTEFELMPNFDASPHMGHYLDGIRVTIDPEKMLVTQKMIDLSSTATTETVVPAIKKAMLELSLDRLSARTQ
jgi:hypothetical protein